MLKARAGFTLAEVLIALTITAVIGAAVTGVFVTQSRFFDYQEKTSFARDVSRGALNVMLSELRMLESSNALVTITDKRLTFRAPYAMGVSCGTSGGSTIVSRVPTDSVMFRTAQISGYGFRNSAGNYTYQATTTAPASGTAVTCTNNRVRTIPSDSGGRVLALSPANAGATPGLPVLLYQTITYEFRASTLVPGRIALWRTVENSSPLRTEELVAPFDTTARFRYYVADSLTPDSITPAASAAITGVELTLNGMSERPDRSGKRPRVPLVTSVFFRNR